MGNLRYVNILYMFRGKKKSQLRNEWSNGSKYQKYVFMCLLIKRNDQVKIKTSTYRRISKKDYAAYTPINQFLFQFHILPSYFLQSINKKHINRYQIPQTNFYGAFVIFVNKLKSNKGTTL